MKLQRSVLAAVVMVTAAVATAGCKSGDKGAAPGNTSDPQPAVQAPGDTATPANNDDQTARRGRRHGRGRGEWRKRRAQAQDADPSGPQATPSPGGPEVPAQQ